MARITTLAVFKGGFNLAYRPPYSTGITQSMQVSMLGHQVHKVKNIRLGQGSLSGGYQYFCHVVFPHMPEGKKPDVHVSKKIEKKWIDNIVLSALEKTCPNHILQHHPFSFAQMATQSEVQKEIHPRTKFVR